MTNPVTETLKFPAKTSPPTPKMSSNFAPRKSAINSATWEEYWRECDPWARESRN